MSLKDLFTYPAGVDGRRKLRTYVKVTLFVFAALIVFWVVALYQQEQERQRMSATLPVVVDPTPTLTPEPTQVTEACPSDPSEWTMVDILPNDVYKRIEPVCVYDGLAKSVAWALAIQEGYSRQAAADLLGFAEFPMVQMNQVTIATNLDPVPVDVYFVPPVPEFTEWYFTGNEEPAVSFSVRGCFRTFTIVGSEKQDWGNGYSVVCELAMDVEATDMLMCLNQNCYTSTFVPSMFTVLYGYAGSGDWDWLGTESNSVFPIDDSQTVQNSRATFASLNGVVPWDSTWLAQAYHVEMRALPDGWADLSNDDDLQSIVSSINAYLAGGANP